MKKITEYQKALSTVKELVSKIDENSYDDEMSHSLEDQLYTGFIRDIADDKYSLEEIRELSKIIIKTQKIEFQRHCA